MAYWTITLHCTYMYLNNNYVNKILFDSLLLSFISLSFMTIYKPSNGIYYVETPNLYLYHQISVCKDIFLCLSKTVKSNVQTSLLNIVWFSFWNEVVMIHNFQGDSEVTSLGHTPTSMFTVISCACAMHTIIRE